MNPQAKAIADTVAMLERVLNYLESQDPVAAKNLLRNEISRRKSFLEKIMDAGGRPTVSPRMRMQPFTSLQKLPSCGTEERKKIAKDSETCSGLPSARDSKPTTNYVRKRNSAVIERPEGDITNETSKKPVQDGTNVDRNRQDAITEGQQIGKTPPRSSTQTGQKKTKQTIKSVRASSDLEPLSSPNSTNDTNVNNERTEKQAKNFDMIVTEVLQTERDYVRDLQIVVEVCCILARLGYFNRVAGVY